MQHFVIMGCGRVGATLAGELEAAGHTVAVVDQNPEAFRRLPETFAGQQVTGLGFDRDTLAEARTDEAFAFAAVSDGDNSNIIAARVARETFGVERVVARIYDPGRAEIYQRLGIPTVATVRWTTDQVLRRILPVGASELYAEPTGKVRLLHVDTHPAWAGRTVGEIEQVAKSRAAFVTRGGEAELVTGDTVLQDGDELALLVPAQAATRVERLLNRKPAF